MPNKKNQCPQKCVTRQFLETVAIQDLENIAQNFVCPRISQQFNGPGPSEYGPCDCGEDDCSPGRCCSLDRQCEEMAISRRRKEVESLPSQLERKAELDAVVNKIVSCRDFYQKLTLEAQDILQPKNSEPGSCCAQDPQYERYAQKQNMQRGAGGYSKHTDMEDNRIEPNKPMVQNSNNVGSKKQMCAPTSYSSLQDQCTSKLHTMPPTPQRSVTRNCSVPIPQPACKVKDGRMCKRAEEKLNIADSKIGTEITPEAQNSKYKRMNLFQKVLGKKQSDCSCEGSRKEETKQNKDKKVDCFCEENATKGIKKSDCFCDGKIAKQNKENERRIICKAARSVNLPQTSCPCCFPPSYNQYFNCTGQVSGNCHCDKNI